MQENLVHDKGSTEEGNGKDQLKFNDIDYKEKLKGLKIDEVWSMLEKYSDWKSLMGTSIQSNPSSNEKAEVRHLTPLPFYVERSKYV
jgi:hypothetical protein